MHSIQRMHGAHLHFIQRGLAMRPGLPRRRVIPAVMCAVSRKRLHWTGLSEATGIWKELADDGARARQLPMRQVA